MIGRISEDKVIIWWINTMDAIAQIYWVLIWLTNEQSMAPLVISENTLNFTNMMTS